MFSRNMFRAKLMERGKTLGDAAKVLGISEVTVQRKMNGTSCFDIKEVWKLKDAFGFSNEEVDAIFFAEEVTETKQV